MPDRSLAGPDPSKTSPAGSCPGCDEESCAGHGDSRPAALCHACQEAGCTVERSRCASPGDHPAAPTFP